VRLLLPLLLLVLAAGCQSSPDSDRKGRVLVVDVHGTPLPAATVLPYEERDSLDPSNVTGLDLRDYATDAHGIVEVVLGNYYWSSDACYHFRVHRAGFETETLAVSKELFPAEFRIELKPVGQP
jgi:hypothetical protein